MATSNSIPSNNPISSQHPFFPSGIGDGNLFDVREGVPIKDALNQASCFLASAKTAAYEADENADFGYAAAHLIELAKALVDSAIESVAGASKQEAAEVNLDNSTLAGGKACMEALRKLEVTARGDDGSTSAAHYLQIRDTIISDFAALAGDLSPRATGFMETLVDFALSWMEAGEPDLDKWKSKASMDEDELVDRLKIHEDAWPVNSEVDQLH